MHFKNSRKISDGKQHKRSVHRHAHSDRGSLLQTQCPCVLWFSALNNALNRICSDTLWCVLACLPTHIDEFSSQGSAVLKQGKHPLPSGRCENRTVSWETAKEPGGALWGSGWDRFQCTLWFSASVHWQAALGTQLPGLEEQLRLQI